jgi:hypothetical protein
MPAENVPAGQATQLSDEFAAACGPYLPGEQLPLHALEFSPADAPKRPGGHALAWGDVDAAGQNQPAAQSPEHDAFVSPGTAPKLPAVQGAFWALVAPPPQ